MAFCSPCTGLLPSRILCPLRVRGTWFDWAGNDDRFHTFISFKFTFTLHFWKWTKWPEYCRTVTTAWQRCPERALTSKKKLHICAVVASRHFICLLRWIVCVGELHQGSLTSDPSLHLQAAWSAPEFIWAFRPAQMNRTVETKTGPFKLDQTALAWEECFAIFISWKGKLGSTWKYFKRQKISFVHKCLSLNYWIQDFFFIN